MSVLQKTVRGKAERRHADHKADFWGANSPPCTVVAVRDGDVGCEAEAAAYWASELC